MTLGAEAASEPMQPTPLLLSTEEGGRVSRTLVSPVRVRVRG